MWPPSKQPLVKRLDQVIQRLLVSSCKFCLHAMVAGVFHQEFVNVANGFESGGKLFRFFREDAVGGQPVMEAQIRHGLREGRTNAAQQYRYSARLHFMDKMVKAFERHHIGIACTLEAQDDVMNIFGFGTASEMIEAAVKLGSCAKK